MYALEPAGTAEGKLAPRRRPAPHCGVKSPVKEVSGAAESAMAVASMIGIVAWGLNNWNAPPAPTKTAAQIDEDRRISFGINVRGDQAPTRLKLVT